MPLYLNPHTFSGTIICGPGPKTPQGRAISARNATTHGLFARDVVLPALGEDPHAYESLAAALESQLRPANLLERHYAEAIAAASWRLRRLHRWQAQLFEDETLTEDERLDRLDKVLRHEAALHRQIDKAVRMLARDVPALFGPRARERALCDYDATEDDCRANDELELEICRRTREYLRPGTAAPGLDPAALDNTRPVPEPPADTENCQNEPSDRDAEEEWDGAEEDAQEDGAGEPAGSSLPAPPLWGAGGVAPETDKTNSPHHAPAGQNAAPAEDPARPLAILSASVLNARHAVPVRPSGLGGSLDGGDA